MGSMDVRVSPGLSSFHLISPDTSSVVNSGEGKRPAAMPVFRAKQSLADSEHDRISSVSGENLPEHFILSLCAPHVEQQTRLCVIVACCWVGLLNPNRCCEHMLRLYSWQIVGRRSFFS